MLLATFLIGRGSVFFRRFGEMIGFDSGAQIEMVRKLSWAVPDTPIHESFYGYHPPLGFLFPRSLHLLFGLTPEHSIQMVSLIASLAAFFFMRSLLGHLHLLHRPSGIAFLYFTSSIPIQISVSTSVNLDVIILAFGSAVLVGAAYVLWPSAAFHDAHRPAEQLPLQYGWRDGMARIRRHEHALALFTITTALSGALLTKFSGLLLFALPSLLALARPRGHGWMKRSAAGAVACIIAVMISFPYYYTRYYIPEGRFLPLNTEWAAKEDVARAIAKREEDPVRFFVDLFLPTKVHAAQGITHTDYGVNRLVDAWRDLWIRNQWTGATSPGALRMGRLSMHVVPWFMAVGTVLFLRRMRRRTSWSRLGWVLIGFSALHVLALIQYIYRIPFAGYGPAKGLYILPSVWGIGYLTVTAFQEHRLVPSPLRAHIPLLQHALMGAVAAFMIVNHAIPAY